MVKRGVISNDAVIFYAPNISSGGGLVLLKELLDAYPKDKVIHAIFDMRAKFDIESLNLSNLSVISYVGPGLLQKIKAEFILWINSTKESTIIAFHNIPPLFSKSKNTFVYFQNRLLLEENVSKLVSTQRFIWIKIERWITRFSYRPHITYIAQTQSIKDLLIKWLRNISGNMDLMPNVCVIPFGQLTKKISSNSTTHTKWDFIYVSSSELHKNHKNLYYAWALLAKEGIRPSLTVTVSELEFSLKTRIEREMNTSPLPITNLGILAHSDVLKCYSDAGAFIFPSLCESLSQPLIEACAQQLPIIASEADYVRDICDPIQTFDPNSPLSIARAVKRYFNITSNTVDIDAPEIFWQKIHSMTTQRSKTP